MASSSDESGNPQSPAPPPASFVAVVLSFMLIFAVWLVIGLAVVLIAQWLGYLPNPKLGPSVSLRATECPSVTESPSVVAGMPSRLNGDVC